MQLLIKALSNGCVGSKGVHCLIGISYTVFEGVKDCGSEWSGLVKWWRVSVLC